MDHRVVRQAPRRQQTDFDYEIPDEDDQSEDAAVPAANIFRPGEEEAAAEFNAILASLRKGKLSTSSFSDKPPKKRARSASGDS